MYGEMTNHHSYTQLNQLRKRVFLRMYFSAVQMYDLSYIH